MGQDRDPVAAGHRLLDAGGDGSHPDVEFGPGQLDRVTVGSGEIQEPVGHHVADIGDVAVDQRDQSGPGAARCRPGIHAIIDVEQALRRLEPLPRPRSMTAILVPALS